jgi:hypothetical protein
VPITAWNHSQVPVPSGDGAEAMHWVTELLGGIFHVLFLINSFIFNLFLTDTLKLRNCKYQ